MRILLAAIFMLISFAAHAKQFSLRCDDGPHQPLLFTFDIAAQKVIYESPARENPLPGTITRSIGESFLFSVQLIGPDFTDFIWDHRASQLEVGLRGTPFKRTFSCSEIPLRPVTELFETLWPKN